MDTWRHADSHLISRMPWERSPRDPPHGEMSAQIWKWRKPALPSFWTSPAEGNQSKCNSRMTELPHELALRLTDVSNHPGRSEETIALLHEFVAWSYEVGNEPFLREVSQALHAALVDRQAAGDVPAPA